MRILSALVLGGAVGAALASPASPDALREQAAAKSADPLAPLAPLADHAWEAAFPDGKLTDRQQFEWLYGRKFLRNPHQVRDASGQVVYSGETIYGWDASAATIRWWYFNATGGWIDGTVTVEADGALRFDGDNHAGAGQPAKVRSSSRFEGDLWISTTWFERDGVWKQEREMVFSESS